MQRVTKTNRTQQQNHDERTAVVPFSHRSPTIPLMSCIWMSVTFEHHDDNNTYQRHKTHGNEDEVQVCARLGLGYLVFDILSVRRHGPLNLLQFGSNCRHCWSVPMCISYSSGRRMLGNCRHVRFS